MKAILETERLVLREFAAADVDGLFAIIGDEATMSFYLRPFTRDETRQWITRNQRRYIETGYGLWAATLKKSGQFVGDCGLATQDVDGDKVVEIAYHFQRNHWKQGYATEAARGCMRYGFETLGLSKLISLIRPENIASRRVAEKNGLRIARQTIRVGWTHDVWAITHQEWLSSQQKY